jgi:hypothetical protein
MEWLNHDYENGRVVDTSVVDAYFRMELCMQYYWVRLAKKFGWQTIFEKKTKLTMDTSLNKAQHKQELLCGLYLALVGMCM